MSSDREAMFWKVEPLSPSGTPPLDNEDEWFSFDEKPAVFESNGEDTKLFEEPLTRAQVATKFLEELELKNWIKEESFADWLEEKIDLPIFEELPAPECGQNRAVVYPNVTVKQQQQQQHPQQQHAGVDATQTLLREFETVLGDVEACHQINASSVISTLTPPQSPPPHSKQQQLAVAAGGLTVVQPTGAHLLVSLQPLHHHHHQQQPAFVYAQQQHQQRHEETIAVSTAAHNHHQPATYTVSNLAVPQPQLIQQNPHQQQIPEQWNAENLSLAPLVHGNDVANELAMVDEYVRSCAEDVAAASSSSSSSSPPSPCTSSNASCMSSEDSADDPDWCFETVNASSSSSSSSGRKSGGQSRAGRRAKPYSRPSVEDKRVRKKEQNKNAATRYRQKKKQEIKKILTEEQELANRNEKLQAQVKDLQREIGYLKNLMRELAKAKGLAK